MFHINTPHFQKQVKQFAFKFTCESCVHFASKTESCGHGFRTERHRLARFTEKDSTIVFCKEFEIS